uniref:Transferase transferring glycosyl groups n=1 Tax=Rhizophora mucronata TaxID=61149 RepID=A0A2P2KZB4_RHIMU
MCRGTNFLFNREMVIQRHFLHSCHQAFICICEFPTSLNQSQLWVVN